jgi:hypothetical protein
MRYHPVQQAYLASPHRFNTTPAGRRSGKTEIAKRKLVMRATKIGGRTDRRYFAAAPTRDQAKRIWWDDLKRLIPAIALDPMHPPSETDLRIRLVNGSEIWVLGLDKPERIEGSPWDGGVIDEIGNVAASAWKMNVRPALSDRMGWCDLIGVPEGRNHYYELDLTARAMMVELGAASEWGAFHWVSADILPAAEIEAARRDLDELSFRQEYEASFLNFEGQAYYPFDGSKHIGVMPYDRRQPLAFCFDFNVQPGVAAVCQQNILPNGMFGIAVIGEVHIPRNSNTPAVCRRLAADWAGHEGTITCYGDATGGARGSAKVMGSDWDLIEAELRPVFGQRLGFAVPAANPPERSRINAVNSMLLTTDGTVRMMADGRRAPNVVRDFEGVRLLKGGSGEIDKKADPELSHISDAIGYHVFSARPTYSKLAMGSL